MSNLTSYKKELLLENYNIGQLLSLYRLDHDVTKDLMVGESLCVRGELPPLFVSPCIWCAMFKLQQGYQ